jgi:hypothetical protein
MNHSEEENNARNVLPWDKNLSKTLGIPFRTIPRKSKQLEILFLGTKKSKIS